MSGDLGQYRPLRRNPRTNRVIKVLAAIVAKAVD